MSISKYPRSVKFRLGRDTGTAMAEIVNYEHPNVLLLSMTRGIWHRLLLQLPLLLQQLARRVWPTAFLPDTVILKKLKPDWDDEFENEIRMYEKLKPLQGSVIPVFYGEARFEGTRAILVSEVPGVMSCEQDPPRLTKDEFRSRLEVASRALAAFGVVHEDNHLDNVFLVGDGVMLLDLEMVYEEDDLEYCSTGAVDMFLDQYRLYLNDDEDRRRRRPKKGENM